MGVENYGGAARTDKTQVRFLIIPGRVNDNKEDPGKFCSEMY